MLKLNLKHYIQTFPFLLASSFLFLSSPSFSQTYNIKNKNNYTTLEEHLKNQRANNSSNVFGGAEEIRIASTPKEKNPYFSNEQIIKLDTLLREENYPKFYEFINSQNVSDGGIIKYLLSKSSDGHIPTYWLLAHLYSFEHQDEETHKWFYIALIMTQQDSEICSDSSARVASKTLLRDFHNIVDVINRTPLLIVSSMQFSADFVRQLKQRTHPKWVCSYGVNELHDKENVTIPVKYWNETRTLVLKNILDRYNLK